MHIGVLGPATISEFAEYVDVPAAPGPLPRGMGGTPVNFLCRELLRRGYRVTLFTADPHVDRERVLAGPLLRVSIVPYGRPAGRRPARDFFRLERRALLEAIRRERPDVLHAQWTYLYALAAQSSGLPHVITAHDAPLNVLRRELIPYRIAHTMMAYAVIARARRIVSVSPYVAHHLRRFMLYRGPQEVIANGLPDSLFALGGRRPPREGTTFASVLSGWNELKNGKAALEAFASVRAEHPGAKLVMMGHGHEPGGPAERWARARALDAGVEFVGQVPQAVAHARLADEVDVYVHPSLEEACSMALAEASALGLPSIGGRGSGGVPYSLDDGRAGLLVDVRDPAALADGMKLLLRDRALRESMGAAARSYARETFHVGAVAAAYLDVYASLLRKGR